MLVLQLFRCGQ